MDKIMDDDYVAGILAREARDSSQRYQTDGVDALMPRRPTGNAPKPNTRFLRHLIKETDNHNTALKRQEEKDARDRLRRLRSRPDYGSTPKSSHSTSLSASRSRISELAGSRGGERRGDSEGSHERRRYRIRDSSAERERSDRHHRRGEHRRTSRDHDARDRDHRSHKSLEHRRSHHASPETRRSGRERSRSRSRSRSPRRRDRHSDRHRSHKHSRRSQSPTDKQSSRLRRVRTERRSADPEREESRLHHSSRSALAGHTTGRQVQKLDTPPSHSHSDVDSDPLEELVGPLPPQTHATDSMNVRSRGRGAFNPNVSNIDAHFDPNYDPALDVHPDDEELSAQGKPSRRPVAGLMTADDDWDMALEALRDRQRWKQKGEERLRAAGLNEEIIDRWKSNATSTGATSCEDNPDNVRWAKKGEGREWDRGKVMDEDGHIDVRPSW